MITGIVDRFEGNLVVVELEDGTSKDFDRSLFPEEIKVGDSVVLQEGSFVIDMEATGKREEKIKKLMDDVWAD